MPTFEFNMADVPDVMLPIGTGIIEFRCTDIKKISSRGDPAKGILPKPMYAFENVVHTDNPDKGRDYTINAVPESKPGQVTIKRLALSMGLPADSSLTSEQMKDRVWKGNVTHRTYVDNGGRSKMVADVDILIPGDQGY